MLLGYKQWKMLNESVMPSLAIGIASQSSLGLQNPYASLDEAKKKSKKKMHFGDDEDISGDGEMVDAASAKDTPDLDVDLEDEDEGGGGCGEHCGKMSKKKAKKKSKKKMWSDEDDEAPEEDLEDDEEMVDDEEGEEEMGDEVVAKKKPPMGGEEEVPLFSKKKSKKKMKREATEEEAWWASVKNMVSSNPNQKFGDGWTEYQEDALFAPVDQNNLTQAVREPGPGEVGFAPQQRIN